MASAMMERAEFPVHKNRTLEGACTGSHLRVGIFFVIGAQPPRPPQQFSIRKSVRRFTCSKFAEYEIERPFFCARTRPVAARTFRWKERVGPGKRRRRAIVPAGRPLGALRTSKRKMSRRVDWAKAESESMAYDCFIFPKEWKYKTITRPSQLIASTFYRSNGGSDH